MRQNRRVSRGQSVKNLGYGAKGSGQARPPTLFLEPAPVNGQKKLPEHPPRISKSHMFTVEALENTNSEREANDP